MKPNYEAWQIDIEDFYTLNSEIERIKFLLKFAVLAPSAHNSQPWSFSIDDEWTLSVFLDPVRRLPVSDRLDRQSYISIGCAIQAFRVAASFYGYESELVVTADRPNELRVAQVKLLPTATNVKNKDSNHPIFRLFTRTTNRHNYTDSPLPSTFLEYLSSQNTLELKVDVISDPQTKNRIADLVLAASLFSMDDKEFRKELSKYVKSNVTGSKIGIPAFGMGIPTPISFLIPTLIKFVNLNRISRKQDEETLKKYTPTYVVLSTKEDNVSSWLKVGGVYLSIALRAEKEKISTAPWAAPIEVGEYYLQLKEILGADFRPQFLMRVGYANKKMLASPRLSVDDILRK